jgi:acetyltransferase-like isoleucine patch superfamily enzyme
MGPILLICDWLIGFMVRRRADVQVGFASSIRWSRIGARAGILRIGSGSIIRCRVDFDSPNGKVLIGDRCYIGASHLVCHTGISIGDDVIMSWGITVVDHDSHSLNWHERKGDVADWMRGAKRWESVTVRPVHIGDKVWIGFGASILKGVHVGEGAVVGANSVVTRDIAPYTVVAGNPARVVRELKVGTTEQ